MPLLSSTEFAYITWSSTVFTPLLGPLASGESQSNAKKLLKSLPGSPAGICASTVRPPPQDPTAARTPVLPGPGHGTRWPRSCSSPGPSGCAKGAALSCLPSCPAAQGVKALFPSVWGHHRLSVCKPPPLQL